MRRAVDDRWIRSRITSTDAKCCAKWSTGAGDELSENPRFLKLCEDDQVSVVDRVERDAGRRTEIGIDGREDDGGSHRCSRSGDSLPFEVVRFSIPPCHEVLVQGGIVDHLPVLGTTLSDESDIGPRERAIVEDGPSIHNAGRLSRGHHVAIARGIVRAGELEARV